MKKIVLLPLDERPCNLNFPKDIFSGEDLSIIAPEYKILGDKKQPANISLINEFVEQESKDAYGAVISLDMLCYGGLLPSRLHFLSEKEIDESLNTLKEVKKNNPNIKIYAFSLIMRCPKYSSSDEEPDYYEDYGYEIHRLGAILHKKELEKATELELNEIDSLKNKIPKEYLEDYITRRNFNVSVNIKILKLVKEGIIDFLIIPQDDSAPYGYTAIDQKRVSEKILSENLFDKVFMYPGADEVAITLLSKMKNTIKNKNLKVYLKYASVNAQNIIPSYEDRPLGETLKWHVMASGCKITTNISECDIVLSVSACGGEMKESAYQNQAFRDYLMDRNLTEFVLDIKDLINQGKVVSIADNAYANGGDLMLFSYLVKLNLLENLAGYAGWNTSSNTVGTAIGLAVQFYYEGKTQNHLNNLFLRYLEDVGYCSIVRKYVSANCLKQRNFNTFYIKEQKGEIAKIIKEKLIEFSLSYMKDYASKIKIIDLYQPWRRMFETCIKINYNNEG